MIRPPAVSDFAGALRAFQHDEQRRDLARQRAELIERIATLKPRSQLRIYYEIKLRELTLEALRKGGRS